MFLLLQRRRVLLVGVCLYHAPDPISKVLQLTIDSFLLRLQDCQAQEGRKVDVIILVVFVDCNGLPQAASSMVASPRM